MGEFLREYRPPVANLNTIANAFLTRPTRLTLATAVVTREVMFPDVSFYQGDIDYETMKAHTKTIIIRAGQNEWPDSRFERNYAEAKRVGLLVGAYWFYDDRVSPGEQADILIRLLRNKTLELEVYIDWENSYGGQYKGLQNVVAMMQRVAAAGLAIKGVGLYTGYYWFRANSNAITNSSQYSYLRDKPLWLAWYINDPSVVLIPAPWSFLHFWQFGTPAVNWGQMSREIDMNWYNGTENQFFLRYIGTGEENMPYIKLEPSVAGEWRSIRQTTNYPSVPHIYGATSTDYRILPGSFAKANPESYYRYTENVYVSGVLRAQAGDVWWRIYEANGVEKDGWAAEIHLGRRYLNTTLIEDAPPPSDEYVLHVKDGVTRKFVLSSE
jgi:GH25 family lysozyme M1 (1,4-beta-N-acetylmuramidase)